MNDVWFTSDHHFNHTNIIDYCGRPFVKPDGQPDVKLMEEVMVQRWNERVQPGDHVYYLGDFAFGGLAEVKRILNRLNGDSILVKGNHDRHSNTRLLDIGFLSVSKSLDVWMNGKRLYLSHRPPVDLDWALYDLALCGHVHERWKVRLGAFCSTINVGVDAWDFRPISLEEALAAAHP